MGRVTHYEEAIRLMGEADSGKLDAFGRSHYMQKALVHAILAAVANEMPGQRIATDPTLPDPVALVDGPMESVTTETIDVDDDVLYVLHKPPFSKGVVDVTDREEGKTPFYKYVGDGPYQLYLGFDEENEYQFTEFHPAGVRVVYSRHV